MLKADNLLAISFDLTILGFILALDGLMPSLTVMKGLVHWLYSCEFVEKARMNYFYRLPIAL